MPDKDSTSDADDRSQTDRTELSIVIDGLAALDDGELQALADRLSTMCAGGVPLDAETVDVRTIAGPHYGSVQRICPECGGPLHFFGQLEADPENGATAGVECATADCSFTGYGQYRLIDIVTTDDDSAEDRSSVVTGQLQPRYYGYDPLDHK